MKNIYNTFCIITNDNQTISLSNYNKDITYDNKIYKSRALIEIKSVEYKDNVEGNYIIIEGIIDNNLIKREYFKNMNLDNAKIIIGKINQDETIKIIHSGYIKEIKYIDNKFNFHIESLISMLNKKIGNSFSRNCRVELFDSYCRVKEYDCKIEGNITDIYSENIFADKKLKNQEGYFTKGEIIFTSGKNKNLSYKIIQYTNKKFILSENPINTIECKDEFIAIPGCNKTIEDCFNKFQNSENFVGEPFM